MSDELPKGYDPHGVEEKWRTRWRESKTFTPDPDAPGEPYSIVIPPPNVTGALHIGHALNLTLIDALCRHYRQKGRNVLWASAARTWAASSSSSASGSGARSTAIEF